MNRPSYLKLNDRYRFGEKIWISRTADWAVKQFMAYRNGRKRERYEVNDNVLTIWTLKKYRRVFNENNAVIHRYLIVEVGVKDRTVGRPEMRIFQFDAIL